MSPLRRRTITFLAIAGLAAVAAPAAQAVQSNPTGTAAHGRACKTALGGRMVDGSITTSRSLSGERGSSTCTDGTRCDTWTTRQGDGSLVWFSECYDVPYPDIAKGVPTQVSTGPATQARSPSTGA
jgi:hypothetical protein